MISNNPSTQKHTLSEQKAKEENIQSTKSIPTMFYYSSSCSTTNIFFLPPYTILLLLICAFTNIHFTATTNAFTTTASNLFTVSNTRKYQSIASSISSFSTTTTTTTTTTTLFQYGINSHRRSGRIYQPYSSNLDDSSSIQRKTRTTTTTSRTITAMSSRNFIELDTVFGNYRDEMDIDDNYYNNNYDSSSSSSSSTTDWIDDDNNNMSQKDTMILPHGMQRDESDMLEEREDRLYLDGSGMKRIIETCILVGVEDNSKRRGNSPTINVHSDEGTMPYFTLEESMTEMRELIRTAGLECVGDITQRLHQINPKTYIGSGKVEEAKELMEQQGACTVVFDAELTPGQQKALENAFNKKVIQNDFLVQDGEIKVIDRTALILDIFAQHAKTREGKLQVDLALHEYRKPRLTRMWTHLERQSGSGGVGLRGPGETQLEIDSRLLRDRIIVLKQKIEDVQKQRTMHRKGRERTGLPTLSLVGYTNAGKSSLLNYLTRSGVLAESMLFATLDPTTRKVKLPGLKTHPEVLLTDTVGFIQKLPTHLVAAFRATLEEVRQADVLVHVIDVSNPTWEKQERAVNAVLADMKVSDKLIVRVFNKIDLLSAEDAEYMRYEAALSDFSVALSALNGDGMQDFVAVVEEAMASLMVVIQVIVPYSKGEDLSIVHEQGNVEVVDYRPEGTFVRALVPSALASRLAVYSVGDERKTVDEGNNDNSGDDIDWVALGRGRHGATK